MEHTTIDTLHYTKHFEGKGFGREQAEGLATALREMVDSIVTELRTEMRHKDDSFATKGDIKDVKTEIKELRTEIKEIRADLITLEESMDLKLTIATNRGIIWIGVMLAIFASSMLAVAIKYFPVVAKLVEMGAR